MKEAIEGIQQKMDRLVELHTKNDQNNKEMLDILEMMNKFRGIMAKLNVKDPHRVEMDGKASGSQEQAPRDNENKASSQEVDMSIGT
eukprot:2820493-Heterocapsa_arctica.AAC.1